MFVLDHRIRVFVFQYLERDPRFLLLQHKPAAEWPIGPVIGSIQHDEHIQDAVVREVKADTGIAKPLQIMDLSQPSKEIFGDIGLVEWPIAYQAGSPEQPIKELTPGPRIGEIAWMEFEEAFQRLETGGDREHLVRLHLRLQQSS